MLKTRSSKILTVLLFLFSLHLDPDILSKTRGNEEILEFAQNKYGYGVSGYKLDELGILYFQLGSYHKSFNLFRKLKGSVERHYFLRELIDAFHYKKDVESFRAIEKMIDSLGEDAQCYYRYIALLRKYIDMLNKEEISRVYTKHFNNGSLSKKNDMIEESTEIDILGDLLVLLYKSGLEQEGKNVFEKIESYYSRKKKTETERTMYAHIIHILILSGKEQKAFEYCKKAFDFFSRYQNQNELNIEDLTDLLDAFIRLRKLDYACRLTKMIVEVKGYEAFIRNADLLKITQNHYLLSCANFDQAKMVKVLNSLDEDCISPLIQMGYWNDAKMLAERIVPQDNDYSPEDKYYYRLGKHFLKIYTPERFEQSLLKITEKIKDTNLKGKLMVEAAVATREYEYDDDCNNFLKWMNLAEQATGGDVIPIDLSREIYSFNVWLESGYPENALKSIEKTKNLHWRSYYLYLAGEFYSVQLNKSKALEIYSRFPYNSVYKGLLLSKVASIDLCMGEIKTALKLYKEALLIMHNNEDGKHDSMGGEYFFHTYNSHVLQDYIYSQMFGKVKRTFKRLFSVTGNL